MGTPAGQLGQRSSIRSCGASGAVARPRGAQDARRRCDPREPHSQPRPRFGLVEVDGERFRGRAKPSGYWLGDVAKWRALPPEPVPWPPPKNAGRGEDRDGPSGPSLAGSPAVGSAQAWALIPTASSASPQTAGAAGSRPRGALRVFSGGPTWARRDAAQPRAERLRGQVGAVRPRDDAQLRIDAHLREVVGIAERLEDAAPVAAGELDFADGPVSERKPQLVRGEDLDVGDVGELAPPCSMAALAAKEACPTRCPGRVSGAL